MRFLCLHGRGTNAEIFKNQTARICESIEEGNEFVFINGRHPTDTTPGITSNAIPGGSERLGFVPLPADPKILHAFLSEMRYFIMSNGPFDGLMGFSEGASVAVTLMVEDARQPFANFKCAILFCALDSVNPAYLESQPKVIQLLDPITDGVVVQVPTAHIWSRNDDVALGMPQKIESLFEKSTREVLVHDLGHEVPGSRSDEKLREAIRVINHTIERATL